MIASSVSALTLIRMRAACRPPPRRRPPRISSISALRRLNGATSSLRNRCGRPKPGQVVEEVGDVRRDVLVGREEPEVLVEPRRARVVVAGADVDVAAQLVALAADDERRLRVDLQVGEPVDDVDARPARALSTTRCCGARRSGPSARRGRRSACPSSAASISAGTTGESSLVRYTVVFIADHVRVLDGVADERLDARRERVVRKMDEHVAASDLREEVAPTVRGGEPRLRDRYPRLVAAARAGRAPRSPSGRRDRACPSIG